MRESKPSVFEFQTEQLVSAGPPREIRIHVYCCKDPMNRGAPDYRTDGEKTGLHRYQKVKLTFHRRGQTRIGHRRYTWH